MLGVNPTAERGELYTTAWGGHPDERARLYRFLRDNDIVDNVVVSGDSHGWLGWDSSRIRSRRTTNRRQVEACWERSGSRWWAAPWAAPVADAETFDTVYRPAALGPLLALEHAAEVTNPTPLAAGRSSAGSRRPRG